MSDLQHGISIGIERSGDNIYLMLTAIGTLTHADYELMTPILESALAGLDQPEIVALVDITQLEGISLHAAWDDLQLGLKHGKAFHKVAIVGRGDFQQWMSRIAGWFSPGEFKFFDSRAKARAWLL
ncbi:STAS/SEC14 domain-containing protein [Shewanella algidipiscicola]|uniref:STAS/SEC14 domain-containing protein n=1 Tax=Shewanella algidipiscicola TaxID=614070 RepID=A0ABQ4PIQ4_9GAMM|nr:STAS/SEC14 domain-containing protein [Shewanella algidipiscicola]GIU47474.1 STAS/SEC14 domain-containing protein [Shewanella algidipiscicola]